MTVEEKLRVRTSSLQTRPESQCREGDKLRGNPLKKKKKVQLPGTFDGSRCSRPHLSAESENKNGKAERRRRWKREERGRGGQRRAKVIKKRRQRPNYRSASTSILTVASPPLRNSVCSHKRALHPTAPCVTDTFVLFAHVWRASVLPQVIEFAAG